MEVLPAVLAFLPRYARGPDESPTARHKDVVDHSEGVAISPFDWIKDIRRDDGKNTKGNQTSGKQ